MSRRKVVITGMGAVTPIGNTLAEFWEGCKTGRSGGARITQIENLEGFTTTIAAEVKNFNPELYISKKEVRKMDLFTQYGLAASIMAVQDSGLDFTKEDLERIGVIVSTGIGGLQIMEASQDIYRERGPGRLSPFVIPVMITNIVAGHVAIQYGLKGPNFCVTSACASGTHSIGEALRIVQHGEADVMITGGTEGAITPLGVGGFCALRALTTRNDDPARASRPFDLNRDGFLIGEGAGVIVIESEEHAKARGAKIYCELAGYGRTCDGHHITAPDPDATQAARGMKLAFEDAGLKAEDIDYINAHGTSTALNDKGETLAIKKALGEAQARKVAVSSTKGMTGHMLGAAGGVEAIVCAMAISEGIIPPTINYETPDPDCDLDYVPNVARKTEVRAALSNSLGFGGHNATLCFKKA
ncbi:MAG TPA: beta-ketoacyl-ACP synthase II [Pontiellaceae bacterium]|nr:beta-ketoacyl-ACP synthase II [Pontiellaceae bacterium]HPR83453.1 beta-ketoacyl-ACP synthase II [Pontiellaceae bacterium]